MSLPPLPCSLAPPCLPCIEGRQRAAPHSSFPPTTAPLHTLHMDAWGPASVRGQDQERYFLLVFYDYTRYTMVFHLRRKADVRGVLIDWITAVHCQLSVRFQQDLQSVCFYRLHPHASSPLSPPPLFLVPDPPPVDPLPPQGPAPSATRRSSRLKTPPGSPPRQSSPPPQPIAVDSGATGGGDTGGADSQGAGPLVADSRGAESGGAGYGVVDTGGAASPSGGGVVGAPAGGSRTGQQQQSRRHETLSPQQLRDRVVQWGWVVRIMSGMR
ncbi:unnamed protein product [Closterium sp. NIES-53]